jgi:hypothetical protein
MRDPELTICLSSGPAGKSVRISGLALLVCLEHVQRRCCRKARIQYPSQSFGLVDRELSIELDSMHHPPVRNETYLLTSVSNRGQHLDQKIRTFQLTSRSYSPLKRLSK